MKISKSALDKILSSLVPVNRAQILYKTMKKPTVMLLFSGSCCERVVRRVGVVVVVVVVVVRDFKKWITF